MAPLMYTPLASDADQTYIHFRQLLTGYMSCYSTSTLDCDTPATDDLGDSWFATDVVESPVTASPTEHDSDTEAQAESPNLGDIVAAAESLEEAFKDLLNHIEDPDRALCAGVPSIFSEGFALNARVMRPWAKWTLFGYANVDSYTGQKLIDGKVDQSIFAELQQGMADVSTLCEQGLAAAEYAKKSRSISYFTILVQSAHGLLDRLTNNEPSLSNFFEPGCGQDRITEFESIRGGEAWDGFLQLDSSTNVQDLVFGRVPRRVSTVWSIFKPSVWQRMSLPGSPHSDQVSRARKDRLPVSAGLYLIDSERDSGDKQS